MADTDKLVEEIKIYWTVQIFAAPAAGFLVTQAKSVAGQPFQTAVLYLFAMMPILIGAVYNIVGPAYIHEARRRVAGLESGHDFICPWLALAYLLFGGGTIALLVQAVCQHFQWVTTRSLIFGFVGGAMGVWWVSRQTLHRMLNEEGLKDNLADYLRGLRWLGLTGGLTMALVGTMIVILLAFIAAWPGKTGGSPRTPPSPQISITRHPLSPPSHQVSTVTPRERH